MIERIEIHNGRVMGNRVVEVRGIPSGRRTVEIIRGRKWVRIRVSGRKTFKRISAEALELIALGPTPPQTGA